jgi:integrase/recombinase XerD
MNENEIQSFLDYIKDERNFSDNTLLAYNRDILDFFEHIGGKSYEIVSEEDILAYTEFLESRYAQNSVYRKLVAIKSFFKYLTLNRKIEKLPSENIKSFRPVNRSPETLNENEIEKILQVCPDDEKGDRDKLIIGLLAETGMLISDLLSLKIDEFHGKSYNKFKLIKDQKVNAVVLPEKFEPELKRYIEELRPKLLSYEDEGYLFQGLSRQNFGARLKKYVRETDIKRNISPNMFRNTVAMNLLKAGKGISVVKHKLNFKNISQTGVYTSRNKEKIREMYMKIGIGDN